MWHACIEIMQTAFSMAVSTFQIFNVTLCSLLSDFDFLSPPSSYLKLLTGYLSNVDEISALCPVKNMTDGAVRLCRGAYW